MTLLFMDSSASPPHPPFNEHKRNLPKPLHFPIPGRTAFGWLQARIVWLTPSPPSHFPCNIKHSPYAEFPDYSTGLQYQVLLQLLVAIYSSVKD